MDILTIKGTQAVQVHINMLQEIIKRMANNSANCKTWAITIISAILVLYADGKLNSCNLWICYLPVGLFFFLDCFYLGLERNFVKKQNEFIDKINKGDDIVGEIFLVSKNSKKNLCEKIENWINQLINTLSAVFSFSTLPFYGVILLFIYLLN